MKLIFLLTLSLTFSSYVFSETIYKSYDRNGNPVFSDREPKTKYEIIKKSSAKKQAQADTTQQAEQQEAPIPPVRTIETIREITNSAQADINAVYENIYKSNNEVQGKVMVAFSIDQSGKVSSCSEDESGMTIASFNGKICEKINTLNYGEVEAEKVTKTNFTFQFKPITQ
jgi:hypothetical protein